jgi:hypothetical protein
MNDPGSEPSGEFGGAIRTRIVHHDDLIQLLWIDLSTQRSDAPPDVLLFVQGWYHD